MLSCSSLAVASDGDHLDSEVVSLNSDDLKQQEEDFRRKIELEAEERKLEETLEYQRRIENEAKQKHLGELNKKTNEAYGEKAADGLHDAYLEAGDRDIQVSILLVILSFIHDEMEVGQCCYAEMCFMLLFLEEPY